jgi:hypothetical protein
MHKDARSLFVMPEDGIAPVVKAIEGAQHSLDIKMFLFTDSRLVGAVIAAHRRGVKTRVMLNPARRSGESENTETHRALADAGVEVRDSFDERRELAIEVLDDHIIKRLEHTFHHDWDHSHRLDLSDQGIIEEMEKHGRQDFGSLALEPEEKNAHPDDRKPNHKRER